MIMNCPGPGPSKHAHTVSGDTRQGLALSHYLLNSVSLSALNIIFCVFAETLSDSVIELVVLPLLLPLCFVGELRVGRGSAETACTLSLLYPDCSTSSALYTCVIMDMVRPVGTPNTSILYICIYFVSIMSTQSQTVLPK